MNVRIRNALLVTCCALVATTVARAQSGDPIGDLLAQGPQSNSGPSAPMARQTVARPIGAQDQAALLQALSAARRGDVNGARNAIGIIGDPVARKLATWAMVDQNADSLSFYEVDSARRSLDGFPRPNRRQAAAEKLLDSAGKSPGDVVAWFGGQEPVTPQGAMSLASAYRQLGRQAEAADLIRRWWRTKSFEADPQRLMLSRFGDLLTPDDHLKRADMLLYGSQGPAARDMVALLPADQQPAALARLALRGDSRGASDAWASLPPDLQSQPGVALERASYLRRKGDDGAALALLPALPKDAMAPEAAERVWDERHRLALAAMRDGDWRAAYQAAADCGLGATSQATDSEFVAGWIALTKLKKPDVAARHFAAIAQIGASPITRSRGFYWEGRAAEARGDRAAARAFYEQGAQYPTAFYGQLSAEKLGRPLELPHDPAPTADDVARFEGRDAVQAMRMLADLGQRDLFRVFALSLDDILPSTVEQALLVDAVRGYGDQDTSMRAARGAAQRGFILADRAYPYRTPPSVEGGAEAAFVLAITRQESNFDPGVRSGADARGLMQLLPSTASIIARKMGVGYSASMLYEPEYNMRIGSAYLGQLVDRFSGSYVMATAGYNAGPGRPAAWTSFCGDPRGGTSDPVDFIECIPFSETRNYVMRVMENMQVYRAKLAGRPVPITLTFDLRRGAYGPSQQPLVTASAP